MTTPTSYERLKSELPEISKIATTFPDALQPRVFELLITEFLGAKPAGLPSTGKAAAPELNDKEISGIAHLDETGKMHLSVRDPKASTTNDAARRLTYVTLRAHELLTGNAKASSKEVVVPILKNWRCYTGNTRMLVAKDKGLYRESGMVWLDGPGKEEADKFIKEIQDATTTGGWTAGNGRAKTKSPAPARTKKSI
jgi:hypothetical protein